MKTSVFLLQTQVVLTQTLPTAGSYKSDTCWFHGSQQLLHTTYTPPPPDLPPFHKQRTSPTPAHNDYQTPAPTAPASIPHLADFGDDTNSFLSKSMGHSTKEKTRLFFFFSRDFFCLFNFISVRDFWQCVSISRWVSHLQTPLHSVSDHTVAMSQCFWTSQSLACLYGLSLNIVCEQQHKRTQRMKTKSGDENFPQVPTGPAGMNPSTGWEMQGAPSFLLCLRGGNMGCGLFQSQDSSSH